jgi:hypothetical protein
MRLYGQPGQAIVWSKASFCFNGECVEVAEHEGAILVRNSGNPGVILQFTASEWLVFTQGLRAGEFDHIASPPGGDRQTA